MLNPKTRSTIEGYLKEERLYLPKGRTGINALSRTFVEWADEENYKIQAAPGMRAIVQRFRVFIAGANPKTAFASDLNWFADQIQRRSVKQTPETTDDSERNTGDESLSTLASLAWTLRTYENTSDAELRAFVQKAEVETLRFYLDRVESQILTW